MRWLDVAVPYDKVRRTSWPYGQFLIFKYPLSREVFGKWYMGSYSFIGTEPFHMTEDESEANDWEAYLG